MSERFFGLKITGGDIQSRSAAAEHEFARLLGLCHTYDRFLYPYYDSLISGRSGEPAPGLLGTHAVLWDVGRFLSGADDCCEYTELAPDYREISDFLAEGLLAPPEGCVLLGGFGELITGSVRPWSIREHSRKFCSFCEHISRMDGVKSYGLTGGYLCASIEPPAKLCEIERIYNAKTSGVCRHITRETENII